MDVDVISRKLALEGCMPVIKKAKELLRLCSIRFEGGLGVAESCKAVVCLELACSELQVPFDRQKAIRLSGSSEKPYTKALQTVQNALGIRYLTVHINLHK
ncbi:hypothetical protein CBR_g31090 [Chara braunii]|uniref:ORC6 first cyclin-like domain-containing protein n=1 Tax=Chara braunii TaxID=69332 RepID=A0A388LE96_CHABU|nr:hypothetical protein CBR_g31090 [Chara braunii]|eukprot:GBG80630.1 hypothetical protein CBR_g31090 [Chara braunii]